jgi:hypothetical protein
MVLAESKTVSFDDFMAWLPERSADRDELRDGEILERPKPRGKNLLWNRSDSCNIKVPLSRDRYELPRHHHN